MPVLNEYDPATFKSKSQAAFERGEQIFYDYKTGFIGIYTKEGTPKTAFDEAAKEAAKKAAEKTISKIFVELGTEIGKKLLIEKASLLVSEAVGDFVQGTHGEDIEEYANKKIKSSLCSQPNNTFIKALLTTDRASNILNHREKEISKFTYSINNVIMERRGDFVKYAPKFAGAAMPLVKAGIAQGSTTAKVLSYAPTAASVALSSHDALTAVDKFVEKMSSTLSTQGSNQPSPAELLERAVKRSLSLKGNISNHDANKIITAVCRGDTDKESQVQTLSDPKLEPNSRDNHDIPREYELNRKAIWNALYKLNGAYRADYEQQVEQISTDFAQGVAKQIMSIIRGGIISPLAGIAVSLAAPVVQEFIESAIDHAIESAQKKANLKQEEQEKTQTAQAAGDEDLSFFKKVEQTLRSLTKKKEPDPKLKESPQ